MLGFEQHLIPGVAGVSVTYALVIAAEWLVASTLFVLLGLAFRRRRSVPYLLLWAASSTLVIKSFVGLVPIVTAFDPTTHLLIDHGLDVVMVVVALGAIHYARHTSARNARQ